MVAAGLMAVPAGGPALAQDGTPEARPQAVAPAEQVSEAEVRQIAEATVSLKALNDTVESKLAEAAGDAERASIRQQAQARAVESIRQTGLTVPRYNAIIAAAQRDEALLERIRVILQTM